jgi:uncharacterized protein
VANPEPLGTARRRTPLQRRLGVALLLVSALLATVWALDRERTPPAPDASGTANAPIAATCAPDAPGAARRLALPLVDAAAWRALDGTLVCVTHPLVVAEVFELPTRGWVLAGAERPTAATPQADLEAGTLRVRPVADDLRNGDAPRGRVGNAGAGRPWTDPQRRARHRGATQPPPRRTAGRRRSRRAPARRVQPPQLVLDARAAGGAHGGERDAQLAKLVATLVPLDADVLALAEVENDRGRALDALLEGVNAAQRAAGRGPDADYAPVPASASDRGRDAIRVAIAYRPARLALVAASADRAPVHDRPPLAATFDAAGGERFTVVAVHHKSKGGCPATGDVDRGAGCWDLRRDAQSDAVLDFAAALSAAVDDADVFVLGDLNAYRHEAPARRFVDAGWSLAVDAMPAEDAYSYVYFGRAGALDHAAASPSAAPRITGAAFWRVNADEAPGADAALPTPYRASDHDPLVLAFAAEP